MENLKIREFRNSIINIVNTGDVPVETKRVILSEILLLVEKQADEQVVLEYGMREARKANENNPE